VVGFLLCFSDDEPGTQGPRRVPRIEIEVAFAEGWNAVRIVQIEFRKCRADDSSGGFLNMP
jgi:hypothetical protein